MAKRKHTKAEKKIISNYQKYKKLKNKAYKGYKTNFTKANQWEDKANATKNKKKQAHYVAMRDKCTRAMNADLNRHKRYYKLFKKWEKKYKPVHFKDTVYSATHHKWNNEGRAAIYRTDQKDKPILIAPTDAESEDTTSNVTSWAVDKGAPRSNYARVSDKQVTVTGIITGKTRAKALQKFYKLRTWNSRHYELTFKGNVYYKHLIITSLHQEFSTYKYNLKVSITFKFVYAANVTTSKNKRHGKHSKSSKSVAGNRNKKYTKVTTKRGDTLWGFSQKYGKSVSWLQKVNHIKNPNVIPTGKPLRVR